MDFPGNSIELHGIALLALIAVLFQGYSAKPFSVKHDGMVPVHAASRKGSQPEDSFLGPEYPRFKQGIWLVQITDGSGNKLAPKEEEFCGSLEYGNLFPHVAQKSKKQGLMDPEGGLFQRSRSLGSGKFLVEFKDNSFEGNSRLERHTVTADSGTAFTDAAVMLLDQGHKSNCLPKPVGKGVAPNKVRPLVGLHWDPLLLNGAIDKAHLEGRYIRNNERERIWKLEGFDWLKRG